MMLARISQNIFLRPFLSSIALSRSSKLHPVFCEELLLVNSCYSTNTGTSRCGGGVLRRIFLMSSYLLLQQCPFVFFSSYLDGFSNGQWEAVQLFCSWGVASKICLISSSSCHAISTDLPDPLTPSFPVGLQGYILYQHRAVVCRL